MQSQLQPSSLPGESETIVDVDGICGDTGQLLTTALREDGEDDEGDAEVDAPA